MKFDRRSNRQDPYIVKGKLEAKTWGNTYIIWCYFSMGPTYNKRNCNKRKRYFKIFTNYFLIFI